MDFLVAVDGSNPSMVALEEALRLAAAADASVTVAHAVHPQVYERTRGGPVTSRSSAERSLVLESVEAAETQGERFLEEAAALAAERGMDVETVLLYGDPVNQLVEYAAAEGFDHLFVGHRGYADRVEELVGSVASALVERSPIPVAVIR